MKIFYEGTALFKNKRVPQAGIAHYVYNIYKNLIELDRQNDYVVFGNIIYNNKKSLFHHAVCCIDVDDKILQINKIKSAFEDN